MALITLAKVSTDSSGPRRQDKRIASLALSLQASGFTVMILGLIVLGVVVLSPSLRVLAEQQQQIAQLEAELATVDEEVIALEQQLERWSDRAYVEAQARSRLMFVYPGDITYLVIDDVGEVQGEAPLPVSDTIEVAQTSWMQSLFASYLVAATTDARMGAGDEGAELEESDLLPSPSQGGEGQ